MNKTLSVILLSTTLLVPQAFAKKSINVAQVYDFLTGTGGTQFLSESSNEIDLMCPRAGEIGTLRITYETLDYKTEEKEFYTIDYSLCYKLLDQLNKVTKFRVKIEILLGDKVVEDFNVKI